MDLDKNIRTHFSTQINDRLFKAIFGRNNEESKKWRLELYNALRGSSYTDPDALEINTIENVIYLTMRNDISFLVDSQMTLFEQQSTYNPNMPLRGFLYFAQLYQIYLTKIGRSLHRSSLVKIPAPQFIVFYNGEKQTKDIEILRLSDAFEGDSDRGDFEWTSKMININSNRNQSLQKKCKPLYDYVRYTSRIKENKKGGMTANSAIEEAVNWAIKENLLEGFFKRQKEEVLAMSLTEFDAEEVIRDILDEGKELGANQKAIESAANLLKMNVLTVEQIAQAVSLPLEKIIELQKEYIPGQSST